MRFSQFPSFRKLAGVAMAIAILPVAVACDNQTTEPVATDVETPVADGEMDTEAGADTEAGTIVEVATENGSFNTLVSALQAANLADTLNGAGPYTVFAPTDEAFASLPEGVLDKLLLPENEAVLTEILTYHVVPETIMAADATTSTVATVEGEDLNLVAENGAVTVNEVPVSTADVMASNGVIHVIDSVLVPPSVDVSAL